MDFSMEFNGSVVSVKLCSLCQRDTEYYCNSCQKDLCLLCKKRHVTDLDTKDHYVVFYREKFNCVSMLRKCAYHPDHIYEMFCETCNIPVCSHCKEHSNHELVDIKKAYVTKRQDNKKHIQKIRSDTLYNIRFFLEKLPNDVKIDFCSFQKEMISCHTGMKKMARTLKTRLNELINVYIDDIKCKHSCLMQKNKMVRFILRMQIYEQRLVEITKNPVKLLRFSKTDSLPNVQNTPNLAQHMQLSIIDEIGTTELIRMLSKIQITERGKRKLKVGNESLLTLLSSPVLHKSLTVKDISCCDHISCVTADLFWVNGPCGFHTLVLKDTSGNTLHREVDGWGAYGLHTVNNDHELIYLSEVFNNKIPEHSILKISSDMKTKTTIVTMTNNNWAPLCVYCSPIYGDLLVGMMYKSRNESKVIRYNSTGQLTQTIQYDNTGRGLYRNVDYITENNNGDIVACDSDSKNGYVAVVVTERGGRHRFFYTGPPTTTWNLHRRFLTHPGL